MADSNLDKFNRAFSTGLGLAATHDLTGLEYAKDDHWDSIAHMQLIAALEKEFDIMLDTDDVIGLSSYIVAQDIIKKYGIVLDA